MIKSLQRELSEARDTLDAISNGEVDAVVVNGRNGQQVYSLESPDQPYRLFIERMGDGAISVAPDGRVMYCNAAFANLIGCRLESVTGTRLTQWFTNDSHPVLEGLLERSGRGVASAQCRVAGPEGGEPTPVRVAVTSLPGSVPAGHAVVVTDLSDQERATRLEAARKAAEAANNVKDEFLAILSHELRTPLNAVLGWAQLLIKREDLDQSVARGLEVIERNAKAQRQLINDLLDISRITAGKLRLDVRPVVLPEIIDDAIHACQHAADARQITITTDYHDETDTVVGDANRLQQIVWNLLSNSIKYTQPGGTVHISVKSDDAVAVMEVRDNGQGISPEFMPRLFQLFHQADTGTMRSTSGLGLGLSIVKKLTELHGGNVRVSSDGVGKGTTVTVQLPVTFEVSRSSGAAFETLSKSTDIDASGDTVDLSRLQLLVVDDEPDALMLLNEVLGRCGATVLSAPSGAAALRILEQNRIDLVVTDVGMPEMDGYGLVRHIRAAGYLPMELPLIALTAFAQPEDRRKLLLAGCQMHIAKPVDADELTAAIASLCGRTGV